MDNNRLDQLDVNQLAKAVEQLEQAHADLAATNTKIADSAAVEAKKRAEVARAETALASVMRDGLILKNTELPAKQRELDAAEEAVIKEMSSVVAGEVLQKHAEDPVKNDEEITRGLAWLRRAVRQGLDTRSGDKQHRLIELAMRLQPPLSELDMPMHMLGGIVNGATDWPSRRRQLIEELALLEAHQRVAA
jgi:hypothetical protein